MLKFVLVADAVISFFWRWIGTSIGEQVIHRVEKIFFILLQVIAHVPILIAEVCILKPAVELPEIRRVVVDVLVDRQQEFINAVSIYRNYFGRVAELGGWLLVGRWSRVGEMVF